MTELKNIKLTIEYDGTDYHGWQYQKWHKTVQQTIKEKIEIIAKEKINFIGASRTDAGVHAIAQVANFKTKSRMNENQWLKALNSLLTPDIVIKNVELVSSNFHARFSAKGKTYKYQILNQPIPSALCRNYVWHIHYPLKITAMRKAAKYLIGRHNFSSFRAAPGKGVSRNAPTNPVRTIKRLSITKKDGLITFTIEAGAFLHHMVRNIIGTLVEVGMGKLSPDAIKAILHGRDRKKAGRTAPPQGLFLVKVIYK